MAVKTLDDINKELVKNNKLDMENQQYLRTVAERIDAFVTSWERGEGDREENRREQKKAKSGSKFAEGAKAGQNFDLMNFLGLGSMIAGLTAALGAVTSALAGIRGWEVTALKSIGNLAKFVTTDIVDSFSEFAKGFKNKIVTFADDTARTLLRFFGIDETTGQMARDAKGRFTGKETKSTAMMIDEAFGALRSRIFSLFGLTAAGTLADDVAKVGDDGATIVSKLTGAFTKIVAPLKGIYTAVDTWILGPGAKTIGFLSSVLGITDLAKGTGSVLKLMSKILWPLGILMSVFEGVEAYQNEKGDTWDKFRAGISAFVADFLGAPLDLLGKGLAWVLTKFGFDEEAQAIKDFDIIGKIDGLMKGILDFPAKAIDWVKTLFSDPTQALKDLWSGLMGAAEGGAVAYGSILDVLTWPIKKTIAWVLDKFGFTEISEVVGNFSFKDTIQEGIDSMKELFGKAFSNLPSWESIKSAIISKLPYWMVPDGFKTTEMKIEEKRSLLAEEEDRLRRSKAGENVYYGLESSGQARSIEEIQQLKKDIGELQTQATQPIIVQDNSTVNNSSSAVNQVDQRISPYDMEIMMRGVRHGMGPYGM